MLTVSPAAKEASQGAGRQAAKEFAHRCTHTHTHHSNRMHAECFRLVQTAEVLLLFGGGGAQVGKEEGEEEDAVKMLFLPRSQIMKNGGNFWLPNSGSCMSDGGAWDSLFSLSSVTL